MKIATIVEHESGETTVFVGSGNHAVLLQVPDNVYSTRSIVKALRANQVTHVEWRAMMGSNTSGDLADGVYSLEEWYEWAQGTE